MPCRNETQGMIPRRQLSTFNENIKSDSYHIYLCKPTQIPSPKLSLILGQFREQNPQEFAQIDKLHFVFCIH